MKLKDFIVPQAIVPQLQASDRNGVVRELVGALASAGAIPAGAVDELVAAVIDREMKGSTGFGKGVAVPHTKTTTLTKMVGTVGRSEGGVDFSALDRQPVYSVFLLLSPTDQPQLHLQAMNVVFGNLQEDIFRRFLRQAKTRETILELLDEADAKAK